MWATAEKQKQDRPGSKGAAPLPSVGGAVSLAASWLGLSVASVRGGEQPSGCLQGAALGVAVSEWAPGGHCGCEEKMGQGDLWQEGGRGAPRERTQIPEGWLLTVKSLPPSRAAGTSVMREVESLTAPQGSSRPVLLRD